MKGANQKVSLNMKWKNHTQYTTVLFVEGTLIKNMSVKRCLRMNSVKGNHIYVEFVGRIAQKRRITRFVRDTILHFMPKMRRPVDIEITTVNRCPHDYFALCWGNRNTVEIEIARGSDEVEFDIDEMMLNLAHELIHAKQFLRGDLTSTLRWGDKHADVNAAYFSQPWEREAYNKEEDIYEKYWKKG